MTTTSKNPNWFDIGMDAWALAAESNIVIAMRIGSLAQGGPAAVQEAERMVSEKVAANIKLGCDLMTGKLGSSPEAIVSGSIAHYSKSVIANRKRLSGTRSAQMIENGAEQESVAIFASSLHII